MVGFPQQLSHLVLLVLAEATGHEWMLSVDIPRIQSDCFLKSRGSVCPSDSHGC
jgi:hypothetical protein